MRRRADDRHFTEPAFIAALAARGVIVNHSQVNQFRPVAEQRGDCSKHGSGQRGMWVWQAASWRCGRCTSPYAPHDHTGAWHSKRRYSIDDVAWALAAHEAVKQQEASMNEQLAAIKARRDAITPGVWILSAQHTMTAIDTKHTAVAVSGDEQYAGTRPATHKQTRLADFVDAAPTDIDTLLAEVTAQALDLAWLRSYVNALEIYVPEASRRVAAGEAQAQLAAA